MGLTGDSVTVLEETPSFCFCFVAVTNLHTHTHTHSGHTHTHTHTHTRSGVGHHQKCPYYSLEIYHEENLDILFFPLNSKINKRQNCKEKN